MFTKPCFELAPSPVLLPAVLSASPSSEKRVSTELLPAAVCVLCHIVVSGSNTNYCEEQGSAVFACDMVPDLTLAVYMQRFVRYMSCSVRFIAMLIYMDRITNNKHGVVVQVTVASVYRLLLTALTLACKYWEDHTLKNEHYAKIGGIPVRDTNAMENHFLVQFLVSLHRQQLTYFQTRQNKPPCLPYFHTRHLIFTQELIGWNLYISREEYEEYTVQLAAHSEACPNCSTVCTHGLCSVGQRLVKDCIEATCAFI